MHAVRSAALLAIMLLASGCTDFPVQASLAASGAHPSRPTNASGVLVLAAGEKVQTRPATEELALAFQDAWEFAEEHPRATGYPWVDPATDELVLSAATPQGRKTLEQRAADLSVPYRIREVTHAFAELARIQDDVTRLRDQGVPGAELIWATYPDWRDNRVVVRISEMNEALLDEMADRFGGDTIAIEVLPGGAEAN
jgi:hypothetical protein